MKKFECKIKITIIFFKFSCCGVDNSKDFEVCTNWKRKPVSQLFPKINAPLVCCKKMPDASAPSQHDLDCAITPKSATSNFETVSNTPNNWSYYTKIKANNQND